MIDCLERLLMNDLIEVLITQAQDARDRWLMSKGTENEAFDAGVVQGYWQVLTSLKARALIYNVQFEKYDMAQFEPDEIWR